MPLWISLHVEEEIRKSENTVNDTVSDPKSSKSNAKSLWGINKGAISHCCKRIRLSDEKKKT